jgi:hypothetical protein
MKLNCRSPQKGGRFCWGNGLHKDLWTNGASQECFIYVPMLVTPLLKFNTTFINNNFMVSAVQYGWIIVATLRSTVDFP